MAPLDSLSQTFCLGSRGVDDASTNVDLVDIQVLVDVLPDLPAVGAKISPNVLCENAIPVRRLDLRNGDEVAGIVDEDAHAPALPTASSSKPWYRGIVSSVFTSPWWALRCQSSWTRRSNARPRRSSSGCSPILGLHLAN